jgi:hypothetical protein
MPDKCAIQFTCRMTGWVSHRESRTPGASGRLTPSVIVGNV